MTSESDPNAPAVSEPLASLLGEADAAGVFSDPIEVGDSIVITAAAWDRAGGFGWGGGGGGTDEESANGMGAGGGGSSEGRPVAVIRIGPDGVQVEPVVDLTKIAVTGLLAAIGLWRALRRS